MHGLRAAILALMVALAGCATPPAKGTEGYRFGGTFTESATQSDMSDFTRRMEAHGADDVLLMESFPVQFSVLGLVDHESCDTATAEADSLAYVRETDKCRSQ